MDFIFYFLICLLTLFQLLDFLRILNISLQNEVKFLQYTWHKLCSILCRHYLLRSNWPNLHHTTDATSFLDILKLEKNVTGQSQGTASYVQGSQLHHFQPPRFFSSCVGGISAIVVVGGDCVDQPVRPFIFILSTAPETPVCTVVNMTGDVSKPVNQFYGDQTAIYWRSEPAVTVTVGAKTHQRRGQDPLT